MKKSTRFLFSYHLFVVVILGLAIPLTISSCKKKLVPVNFDEISIAKMEREEALAIVQKHGLEKTYTYHKDVLKHTWMTSYDGKRFRKAHHEMQSFKIPFEDILKATEVDFLCYRNPEATQYIVKSSFKDQDKERVEVELFYCNERAEAEEVITALKVLIE